MPFAAQPDPGIAACDDVEFAVEVWQLVDRPVREPYRIKGSCCHQWLSVRIWGASIG